MFPGLKIVIVNWNSKGDTLECLESLEGAGAAPEQVILIDNGSTDGSVAALRAQYGDRLHLIENATNRGYAPATNQGIQAALESGAEWILLLNNDTLVAPGFIAELEWSARLPHTAPILAPLIFYHADPKRVWYLGDRLIPHTLITTNPYRGKEYNNPIAELVPVDFVSGCAMLVQRQVFESVGVFDPSLVMYGEETDFCWRARLAGFRMAGVPRAQMWHKVSVSANRDKPRARYLRLRNQIRFYRKYARGWQRPLMFGFTLVRALLIAGGDLLRRQANLIPPLVRGWLDGWRGA